MGVSLPPASPPPMREWLTLPSSGGDGSHLPTDRPHEASQFTRDCDADNRRLLAVGAKRSVSGAQARLRFPGNFPNLRGRILQLLQFRPANPRRMPISPSALDQHLANAAIAGFGNRTAANRVPRRALAR